MSLEGLENSKTCDVCGHVFISGIAGGRCPECENREEIGRISRLSGIYPKYPVDRKKDGEESVVRVCANEGCKNRHCNSGEHCSECQAEINRKKNGR